MVTFCSQWQQFLVVLITLLANSDQTSDFRTLIPTSYNQCLLICDLRTQHL